MPNGQGNQRLYDRDPPPFSLFFNALLRILSITFIFLPIR